MGPGRLVTAAGLRPSRMRAADGIATPRGHGWLLAAGLALGAAVLLRLTLPPNEDVSWLIDLAGRTLAGARPYVDFVEVNPPAAILLYLLPTAIAQVLALRPEAVTDALVFVGTGASLAVSARILRRAGLLAAAVGQPMLAIALAVLLVLPAYTFAERDDLAVLAVLPGLAALAARRHGVRPEPAATVLAGLGLGIVVAIKPMFVLGLVGPAAVLLLGQGWRSLAAAWELWIGALVASAYAAAVVLFVPAFVERVLPVAVAVYVPRRLPWTALLASVPQTPWPYELLLLAACARRLPVGPVPAMLASASIGFEGAFLLQGKGFAYHLYPAVSLGLLAVAFGLLEARRHARATPSIVARFPIGIAAVVAGAAAVSDVVTFSSRFDPFLFAPELAPAIQALGPRPRILTISAVFALGQPFARALGGEWVGSAPSTWMSNDAQLLAAAGDTSSALAAAIVADQGRFADDIRRGAPDAVLVEGPRWQAWIDGSPALTSAMTAYRRSGPPSNTVQLWVRKAPQPAETRP